MRLTARVSTMRWMLARKCWPQAGTALDAVEAAVRVLEDNPNFNAGKGAVLTREGVAELDASIMDGRDRRAGAVAQVRTVKNPIRAARHVMETTGRVMFAGRTSTRWPQRRGSKLCLRNTSSRRAGWKR